MKQIEEAALEYAKALIDSYGDNGVPSNIKDIKRMVYDAYIAGAKGVNSVCVNLTCVKRIPRDGNKQIPMRQV